MLTGMPLGSYLLLVDYTGRLFRDGKATISRELTGVSIANHDRLLHSDSALLAQRFSS
jgi:hypothetical protein